MKRDSSLVVVGVAVAVLLAGCAEEAGPGRGGLRPGIDPQVERQIAIYTAMIRRLVTEDHSFGEGGPGLDVVYVLDHPTDSAGSPDAGGGRGEPFSEVVRAGLRAALSDLPPIEFVSDREQVIEERDGFPMVKGKGALLTLGPIPESGARVEIPASLYFTGLAGVWLTYVVEGSGTEWRVTGTTGPIAVS